MASGEMTDEAFRVFLSEALGACARVSRDGAVHFVCMDWRHMDDVAAVGKQVYGDLLNLCFWNKSNAGMGSLYRSKHELILRLSCWRSAAFQHGRARKARPKSHQCLGLRLGELLRRQPPRRFDFVPHSQADCACGGRASRRHGTRGTCPRYLPRLWHNADRGRAQRATLSRVGPSTPPMSTWQLNAGR
jgi:hypothetical protein